MRANLFNAEWVYDSKVTTTTAITATVIGAYNYDATYTEILRVKIGNKEYNVDKESLDKYGLKIALLSTILKPVIDWFDYSTSDMSNLGRYGTST